MTAIGRAVVGLELGRELADLLDERLRLGRVRGALGHDLDDRGVGRLVRQPLADVRDVVELAEAGADRVEVVEDVGGLRDVDGDDERAVVAGAEPVGDEVVGVRVARLGGVGAAARQVQVEAERGHGRGAEEPHDEHDEHDRRLQHEVDPAASHGALRAVVGGVGATVGAALRLRREPAPEHAEQRRQQGDGADDGDEHGERGRDAHDAQERDAHDEQAEQRDDHREAREHDRAARGGDGLRGALLRVLSARELRAMPREDEERVVDADREADHDREHGGGVRHRRERRDDRDAAERGADADERGEQRQAGREQRAERDEQHHAREEHAEDLGDREPEVGVLEHLAAERDHESRVAPGLAGGGHGLDRGIRHVGGGAVELHLDVGRARVIRHLLAGVLVERAEHARDAVDALELGLHRGDRGAVRLVLDGCPVGRLDDGLHRGARGLREDGGELVDRLLRLGAGDGVGLLELAAEADAGAEEGGEGDRPGRDDEPCPSEGESPDAMEEEGHGMSLSR